MPLTSGHFKTPLLQSFFTWGSCMKKQACYSLNTNSDICSWGVVCNTLMTAGLCGADVRHRGALRQRDWRTKMQYPVALFQERSKIQRFGTKCLFTISAGCVFPATSTRRLFLSWKKSGALPVFAISWVHATTCGILAWPQAAELILGCPGLHPDPMEAAVSTLALCCCFQQR